MYSTSIQGFSTYDISNFAEWLILIQLKNKLEMKI